MTKYIYIDKKNVVSISAQKNLYPACNKYNK